MERQTSMSVTSTTHVNFRGQAREALHYYQSVFGGETQIATYTDIDSVEDPAQADQIAFGRLDAPNGFSIMAYDVQPSKGYDPGENPFYITLQGTDGDEIQELWSTLAEAATSVLITLAPAPFAPLYGMLTHRYGNTGNVAPDAAPRRS
jgi:PhnB protein